jgi:hypothetical protein
VFIEGENRRVPEQSPRFGEQSTKAPRFGLSRFGEPQRFGLEKDSIEHPVPRVGISVVAPYSVRGDVEPWEPAHAAMFETPVLGID